MDSSEKPFFAASHINGAIRLENKGRVLQK